MKFFDNLFPFLFGFSSHPVGAVVREASFVVHKNQKFSC